MWSKAHCHQPKGAQRDNDWQGNPNSLIRAKGLLPRWSQGSLSPWLWDGTHQTQTAGETSSFTLQTEEEAYCPKGRDIEYGMPGRSFWLSQTYSGMFRAGTKDMERGADCGGTSVGRRHWKEPVVYRQASGQHVCLAIPCTWSPQPVLSSH